MLRWSSTAAIVVAEACYFVRRSGLLAVVAQDICRSVERVGFQPKLARQVDGFETCLRPPVRFLAGAMQFAMVGPAQRYCEFVADLEAEAAGLREPQMVAVRHGWSAISWRGSSATSSTRQLDEEMAYMISIQREDT